MTTLYNGIRLPAVWPPENLDSQSMDPQPVPYLQELPEVIPIDLGRQLLVDDFLISETTLERVFHSAKKYEGNPIFSPETSLETDGILPVTCPKSGGIWWDPSERIFKMWYEAGWMGRQAYATSQDGLCWNRPPLDVDPPSNRILPELVPDSNTVWIDHECSNPMQRYKMFHRSPGGFCSGSVMTSADGIHWSEPVPTGKLYDRSTIFFNPFRKKWIFSIRSAVRGRTRHYREHDDFIKGAHWEDDEPVFWAGTDRLDFADPAIGMPPQLYNLDAVAYESLILGLFQIHLGPENDACEAGGFPKTTELKLAFSRDGFHWDRPDRNAFIAASREKGAWDRGYIQSVGGVCLVWKDEIWFYYAGFQGDESQLGRIPPQPDAESEGARRGVDVRKNGMYSHGSTGLAKIRRDGFVSMDASASGGELITRSLCFSGSRLFVNIAAPQGELVVEILDEAGKPIESFELHRCLTIRGDHTKVAVEWSDTKDLSILTSRPVRFRFYLRNGSLYSFWVAEDDLGRSGGFLAAGSPDYPGYKDV